MSALLRGIFAPTVLLAGVLASVLAAAATPPRDRIAMLKPRPPEQLEVTVDVSLASLLPGVEKLRSAKRGQDLAAALQKEGFDLVDTLELQVAAALPEFGLRRVALGLQPQSRSKSEGWANVPARDCGCDFWLDIVIEQAGFRADTSLGGFKPTLTAKMALVGALGRERIASTTAVLRPELSTDFFSKKDSATVASRSGAGAKNVDALLADSKGAARAMRAAVADLATRIAREAAKSAGIKLATEPEERPRGDEPIPLPPEND